MKQARQVAGGQFSGFRYQGKPKSQISRSNPENWILRTENWTLKNSPATPVIPATPEIPEIPVIPVIPAFLLLLFFFPLFTFGQPPYKGYPRYSEVKATLYQYARQYPDFFQLDSIATTHEGRTVYTAKIAYPEKPGQQDRPQVLYVAGTHGCEPLSVAVLMRFITYVVENYDRVAVLQQILSEREMHFVPLLNPDGYTHYWRFHPLWKSNRNPNDGQKKGVDLNRNFGYEWGFDEKGSKAKPGQRSYRGTAPFSEPEAAGFRDFVRQHQFVASFSYHSFGAKLLYPYNYSDRDPEDLAWYQAYCGHLCQYNGYRHGNPKNGLIYHANGDMDDWLYGQQDTVKQKTLAITVELAHLFLIPAGGIEKHFQKTLYQNLFMPMMAKDPQVVMNPEKVKEIEKLIKEALSDFARSSKKKREKN